MEFLSLSLYPFPALVCPFLPRFSIDISLSLTRFQKRLQKAGKDLRDNCSSLVTAEDEERGPDE